MPLALLVKGFYSVMVMTVLSMMWGYARALTSGRACHAPACAGPHADRSR